MVQRASRHRRLAGHRDGDARDVRERPPELEEAHRRARHVGGDRLVADDQQARPRVEHARQLQLLDERFVNRPVRGDRRQRFERAPEVVQDLARPVSSALPAPTRVAPPAPGDRRAPRRAPRALRRRSRVSTRGVARAASPSPADAGLNRAAHADGSSGASAASGVVAEVEPALVEDAPDGEQQRDAERAAQRGLAVVLDQRPERVALHQEALLAGRLGAAGAPWR